jgi:hypothetical protein
VKSSCDLSDILMIWGQSVSDSVSGSLSVTVSVSVATAVQSCITSAGHIQSSITLPGQSTPMVALQDGQRAGAGSLV